MKKAILSLLILIAFSVNAQVIEPVRDTAKIAGFKLPSKVWLIVAPTLVQQTQSPNIDYESLELFFKLKSIYTKSDVKDTTLIGIDSISTNLLTIIYQTIQARDKESLADVKTQLAPLRTKNKKLDKVIGDLDVKADDRLKQLRTDGKAMLTGKI